MHGKSSIRLGQMFCPATDRNVPILFRHEGIEIGDVAMVKRKLADWRDAPTVND